MRHAFEDAIRSLVVCQKPWQWGAGPKDGPTEELAEVLQQHGVPADQAQTRAQAAIKVIGASSVAVALKSANPWKQLKVQANQHRFQFLLPTELQAVIDKRKQQPVGPKKRSQKTKLVAAPQEVDIDVSRLQIVDGAFRSQNTVVPQIQLKQVNPLAAGVALANLADAEPFMRSKAHMSAEPLALLVLGNVQSQLCTLPMQEVDVPCRCLVNKEPVILNATLLQLGSVPVHRHVAKDVLEVHQIQVSTLKVLVFRDELVGDWSECARAPIRFLVQHLPCLTLCVEKSCDCPCWHNEELLDVADPIMDCWRRQFLKPGFRPEKPREASMFSALLRVPSCLQAQLLGSSGENGIYLEPRSEDGKQIDALYSVVWTPKLSQSELAHLKQTLPCVIGLARLDDRRGLRVLASQAKELHRSIKPGVPFLPTGNRETI